MAGKGVLQLAQELLQLPGRAGLSGLLQAGHADLKAIKGLGPSKCAQLLAVLELARRAMAEQLRERPALASDRKSTRLNSSHSQISYAVFCLKKKKKDMQRQSSI